MITLHITQLPAIICLHIVSVLWNKPTNLDYDDQQIKSISNFIHSWNRINNITWSSFNSVYSVCCVSWANSYRSPFPWSSQSLLKSHILIVPLQHNDNRDWCNHSPYSKLCIQYRLDYFTNSLLIAYWGNIALVLSRQSVQLYDIWKVRIAELEWVKSTISQLLYSNRAITKL